LVADAGRTLTPDQRASILSAFRVLGLPLYLRLAFEEARQWRSYDGVPALSEDVPGVLRDFLSRLSHPAAHGEVLVRRTLGYLGAARNGLADAEMLEVLSRDEVVMADVQRSPNHPATDALPPVVWSRLYFDLEPYLIERRADRTSLLGFYHRQFAEVVAGDYVQGEAATDLHRLADYFGAQANHLNYRKASELVTQEIGGQVWDRLEARLTDLTFLEMKAEAGMVFDPGADFSAACAALPHRNLRLLGQALRGDLHFLARHPTTVFQCLWNRAWWYDCPDAAKHCDPPEGGWGPDGPPWNRPEPKLSTLLDHWRQEKESCQPGFAWVRSLRPPRLPLGGRKCSACEATRTR
jgi:hypothetical protein